MEMKKVDTFKIARDIISGKWLISDSDKALPIALDFLSRLPVRLDAEPAEPYAMFDDGSIVSLSSEKQSGERKKVVIVPLHGTMTKYETCTSYGTMEIADKINGYAADNSILGIVLDVDSGGGAANSIAPLVEAIRKFKASGKPIIAHCDTCGSAAFWVASQCDAIYMDNSLSEIGSVGALVSIVDSTAANPTTGAKIISIYARESKDKNLAYREALEGKYSLMQDELSPLVQEFQSAVIAGRPNLKKDEDGVLSGRMFLSGKAIELGMADAVRTLSETVDAVFALSEF